MLLVTPLKLKSTKGMLEMQRLQPEMRRLQQQYRGDRQKLNEEMMKLYQEHKVNPMASCLPLLLQIPVFIIMFRVLHGLTYTPTGGNEQIALAVMRAGGDTSGVVGFLPAISRSNPSCTSRWSGKTEMTRSGSTSRRRPRRCSAKTSPQGSSTPCSWHRWPGCTSSSSAWWPPGPR